MGEVVSQGRGRRPGGGAGAGPGGGAGAGLGAGPGACGWAPSPGVPAASPDALTSSGEETLRKLRGLCNPPRKAGVHTLGTPRSDPRPFEPSHQRPGFQAPAGPASGPGLSQARQQLEKGRGWEDWGPGSLLRSRPGPRQWLGRGRRRQQREPLTPHHSPGRLASITRGSGSSAGYPPSKNSSEPQSRPQTGGAAWGGGRVLVRWGQGQARHCPSEQREGSLQSPRTPGPSLSAAPPFPPSFLSCHPSPLPSPPRRQQGPGPTGPTWPGRLTHWPTVRALVRGAHRQGRVWGPRSGAGSAQSLVPPTQVCG